MVLSEKKEVSRLRLKIDLQQKSDLVRRTPEIHSADKERLKRFIK